MHEVIPSPRFIFLPGKNFPFDHLMYIFFVDVRAARVQLNKYRAQVLQCAAHIDGSKAELELSTFAIVLKEMSKKPTAENGVKMRDAMTKLKSKLLKLGVDSGTDSDTD